ncbi:MAG: HAD hydrolase family protein, partial [Methanobrevibacter sp.]|nr:HAD hydrolase family protein [Methanobrevibacter sp.]
EANDSQKLEVLGDINKVKKAYKHLKSNLEEEYDFEIVDDSDSRLSELAFYRTIDEKIVKEKLKDFDVEVYDTQFAIHLTDPNVNKGSSLEIVAKNIKIKPEEILAIGDSENDLEFLKVAGYKVAVANADESMKEIADYITKKPYGDGVAEIINKFFL